MIMKRQNRRIILLLLALVMLCDMMPMTAFAAEDAGSSLDGLNVLCLGDSITAGQGLTVDTRWTNVLASKYGWNMTNISQGGIPMSSYYYTANGQADISIAKKAEVLKNMAPKPDVIIVWGGHNDVSYRAAPLGTWDDETTDSFKGALKHIAELAKEYAPDATLFVLTPLWHIETPSALKVPAGAGDTSWSFVDAIYEGAEQYGWVPINMDLCGITPFTKSGLLLDSIHPNAAGTEKIVAYLSEELASHGESSRKETIVFSKSAVSLKIGERTALKGVPSPRSGSGSSAITWSSSDPSVAIADASGIISAVAPGTAIVTATAANGASADINVSVVCEHIYEDGFCAACGEIHPNLANYNGKVISVLGDSISTFAGYIPEADGFNLAHKSRYPQDDLLTDVNETWWLQLIHTLNAKLGINDSWASTEVYNYIDEEVNSTSDGTKACMASMTRIQNLGSNGTPDVILFFGGTNDITQSRPLGSFDPAAAPTEADLTSVKWDTVADAYVDAIMRLQYFYPDAEIIAMLPYHRSSQGAAKVNQYDDLFASICDHYGVPYADLRNCGITGGKIPDGTHADADGMDDITAAVMNVLMTEGGVTAGEHTVYSVTHRLTNAKSSLGHYKGISRGKPFETAIAGENLQVTVTMGGADMTAECYIDGVVTIANVTGDLVITAEGAPRTVYADYLQKLPDALCSKTNLWTALHPINLYFRNTGWGLNATGSAHSITFAVSAGDRIWATSFQESGINGGAKNGIALTWFDKDGAIETFTPEKTYAEFSENGCLTAPEGAVAVNVVMWNGDESNEVYLLSRGHTYESGITAPTCTEQGFTTHTCTVCGESYADSYTDALGYDWILEDGCLKILFIGDSYSEDATNCGQGMQQSQLLNILQAMLGGDTEITLGLCYNGGKAMAWHATQAERETSAYSLRTIRTGGVWKGQGKCTSAEALQWTDWDIVVLQPSQAEARKGVDSNRNGDSEDEKFYPYETSIPYMLDHVAANAPQAAVCYYGLWVTDKTVALNAGLRTYEMIKAVTKDVFRYKGTNSGCRFSDAIPVGAAIQNARTSYLALLSYHPEETITLSTDPQFGLQRDVSHLSFNIGRYIAALTVAETVIPAALRVKDYTLPAIRVTESVGELPRDYTALAQAAVSSAVKNWHENGSLDVIPLKDSETDPALLAQHSLEGAKIAVTVCEADLLPKTLRTTLEARLKDLRATWPELEIVQVSEPVIYGEHPLYYAEVALRFGYTEVSFRVGGRLVLCGHRETDAVTPPTCTERGYTTHICTVCGESYVDGYTDPLVTVTEDAAGLTLAGLPEGVTAVAAGYGGAGRMRFAAVLTGPEAALAWPGGERPARLRVFFLDAQGAPVSGRWES